MIYNILVDIIIKNLYNDLAIPTSNDYYRGSVVLSKTNKTPCIQIPLPFTRQILNKYNISCTKYDIYYVFNSTDITETIVSYETVIVNVQTSLANYVGYSATCNLVFTHK